MQVHWEHVMLELTCSQPVLYHAARSGDHSRRAGYCWELFGHWRQRLRHLTRPDRKWGPAQAEDRKRWLADCGITPVSAIKDKELRKEA